MTAPQEVLVSAELRASIENERREIAKLDAQQGVVRGIRAMLAIIAVAILVVAYWWLFPYQTVNKTPMPMPIVAGYETVRQGGVVLYEYDYTKYTDVVPTVHRQFVDGLIFDSADASTHLLPGTGHVHVQVPIPVTLPPGRYHLQVITEFQMNPIRLIRAIDMTQDFMVLPALGDADADQDSTRP